MNRQTNTADAIARILPMSRRQLAVVLGLDADQIDRAVAALIGARVAREHVCAETGKTFVVARTRLAIDAQQQHATRAASMPKGRPSGHQLVERRAKPATPWRQGGAWNKRRTAA